MREQVYVAYELEPGEVDDGTMPVVHTFTVEEAERVGGLIGAALDLSTNEGFPLSNEDAALVSRLHTALSHATLISIGASPVSRPAENTEKRDYHPMGIFEDYEGCDSGIDTTPRQLTNPDGSLTQAGSDAMDEARYEGEIFDKG